MARCASVFGLWAPVAAVAAAVPARAKFWGCNSKNDRGRVLYSYSGTPGGYAGRYSSYLRGNGWATHQRVGHSRAYYGSNHSWNGNNRSRW